MFEKAGCLCCTSWNVNRPFVCRVETCNYLLDQFIASFFNLGAEKKGFGLDGVQSRNSNAKSRTLQIPSKKTETWWEYKLSFKYSW